MRPIKFRAWRLEKMIYPKELQEEFYFDFDNGVVRKTDDQILSNQFILMQFTGLLDKNGKEIYEGDIVKYQINFNPKKKIFITGKIEFKDCSWIIVSRIKGVGENDEFLNLVLDDELEVIGNIYENPELLK